MIIMSEIIDSAQLNDSKVYIRSRYRQVMNRIAKESSQVFLTSWHNSVGFSYEVAGAFVIGTDSNGNPIRTRPTLWP
jgi:hypothetical protein